MLCRDTSFLYSNKFENINIVHVLIFIRYVKLNKRALIYRKDKTDKAGRL